MQRDDLPEYLLPILTQIHSEVTLPAIRDADRVTAESIRTFGAPERLSWTRGMNRHVALLGALHRFALLQGWPQRMAPNAHHFPLPLYDTGRVLLTVKRTPQGRKACAQMHLDLGDFQPLGRQEVIADFVTDSPLMQAVVLDYVVRKDFERLSALFYRRGVKTFEPICHVRTKVLESMPTSDATAPAPDMPSYGLEVRADKKATEG